MFPSDWLDHDLAGRRHARQSVLRPEHLQLPHTCTRASECARVHAWALERWRPGGGVLGSADLRLGLADRLCRRGGQIWRRGAPPPPPPPNPTPLESRCLVAALRGPLSPALHSDTAVIDFFNMLEEEALSAEQAAVFPATLIKCQVFRCDMKFVWLL